MGRALRRLAMEHVDWEGSQILAFKHRSEILERVERSQFVVDQHHIFHSINATDCWGESSSGFLFGQTENSDGRDHYAEDVEESGRYPVDIDRDSRHSQHCEPDFGIPHFHKCFRGGVRRNDAAL
jgi:hypothetical protein